MTAQPALVRMVGAIQRILRLYYMFFCWSNALYVAQGLLQFPLRLKASPGDPFSLTPGTPSTPYATPTRFLTNKACSTSVLIWTPRNVPRPGPGIRSTHDRMGIHAMAQGARRSQFESWRDSICKYEPIFRISIPLVRDEILRYQ